MRKGILLLTIAFVASLISFAQTQEVCGSYQGYLEDDKKKHPEFYNSLHEKELKLKKEYASSLKNMKTEKESSDGKKIIPVVVHIIHTADGKGNISDESVYEAIEALNKNINGQSDKFEAKTPDVFAALRGVANVEFRLAKIDPEGNSTTGILRVESELSDLSSQPEISSNTVKTLSYWNSFAYYNLWVVYKFAPLGGGSILLGYAQFPGQDILTDGVVLVHNHMEDPESTTLTHETGHWLGLCHPWDCSSGTCGSDNVFDTPTSREANGSSAIVNGAPTSWANAFPYHVGLYTQGCLDSNQNWAGEMFMNYMDYTNDDYCTMFSKGQVEVFKETLEGTDEDTIGFREYLWSDDNIFYTGVDDGGGEIKHCSREADFSEPNKRTTACQGTQNQLVSNHIAFSNINSVSWNLGDTNFSFSSGTTYDTNNISRCIFTYDTTGSYDISLTIRYDEQLTRRASDSLSVSDADNIVKVTEQKLVQGTQDELIAMGAFNIVEHSVDSILFDHDANSTTPDEWRNVGVYWDMIDTSFFRGKVDEIVWIGYYNKTCTTTTQKKDYLIIEPVIASQSAKTYTFADSLDLGADWNIVSNQDMDIDDAYWSITGIGGSNIDPVSNTWEWIEWDDEEGNTNASLMMDGKNNFSFGTDELVSKGYNLESFDTPSIKFSWAGAAINSFPVNELKVEYSTSCGQTWLTLGTLTAVETARSGYIGGTYFPNTDDWLDTVMTKPQLKSDNIRFKFSYTTNDYQSNRLYIDNIEIGEDSILRATMQDNNINHARLSIYPNPSEGYITLELQHLLDKSVSIKLINILGKEIINLYEGVIISDYQIIDNLNLNSLGKGVYFISISVNNDIVLTDKFILDK